MIVVFLPLAWLIDREDSSSSSSSSFCLLHGWISRSKVTGTLYVNSSVCFTRDCPRTTASCIADCCCQLFTPNFSAKCRSCIASNYNCQGQCYCNYQFCCGGAPNYGLNYRDLFLQAYRLSPENFLHICQLLPEIRQPQ